MHGATIKILKDSFHTFWFT